MKIIFDYNRTIFDPETNELYPGVFELLRYLQPNHELFLVSRDEPSRKTRLQEFNIVNFFKEIYFVPEKTKELYEKISDSNKNTLVIGDSINSEIKIGNQLGLVTVRIKQGIFKEVLASTNEEVATFEVDNINKLKDLIEKYEKN